MDWTFKVNQMAVLTEPYQTMCERATESKEMQVKKKKKNTCSEAVLICVRPRRTYEGRSS